MKELDKTAYISLNGGWKGLGENSQYSYSRYSTYELSKIAQRAGYQILYGVQTSEKTQVDEAENKYGRDWYPVGPQELTNYIRIDGTSVLHINSDTKAPEAVPYLVKHIYSNAQHSPYLNVQKRIAGIQFNRLPWHNIDYTRSFERIARILPVSRYILQASELQISALSPSEFVKYLEPYTPYVSTVLLDESSGTGKPLDPQKLRPYIDALYQQTEMPSVAVAGGLNPANVGFKLEGLLADFPGLSIDAETGLRDNYDRVKPKDSTFSSKKARDFVSKIIELC